MEQRLKWNPRQKLIVSLLLQRTEPITLKEISEKLIFSTRTIQRELEGMSEMLVPFGLLLIKKSGVGLSIEGSGEQKRLLLQQLTASPSVTTFSQEERKYFLIQTLLTNREPVKLYYFSMKLGVAEATVSNDLDKLVPWLSKHGIQLVRRPGLGVYIEADEKSIRSAIADHVHQHMSQEQLMDMLNCYSYSFGEQKKLGASTRNHLLHLIDPGLLALIEEIVQQSEQWQGYEMSDNAYIALVVHITLAVQRLKKGEHISIDESSLLALKETQEFEWAQRLAGEFRTRLDIEIPESEVGYITTHLLGAKGRRLCAASANATDAPRDVETYVQRMIHIVEVELKVALEGDQALYEALLTHLEAAINRIVLRMEIRNPMLDDIKNAFPDIYEATAKASLYLEEQLGVTVPQEEIGYLTMHFGASIVRNKPAASPRIRVLVTCNSGMGTSRLLAAQIERNFPHFHIVDTVSLLQLEASLRKKSPVDLIISTVPFQHERHRVVVVNPFLEKQDIELIEANLNAAPLIRAVPEEEQIVIEDTVMTVTRYGEGVVQLTDHLFFAEGVEAASKEDAIQRAVRFAESQVAGIDPRLLEHDLTERERIRGLVFERSMLTMLHCRTDAVPVMMICLVRLKRPVLWMNNGQETFVRAALLLLAPRSAPDEHLEMVSEISSMLIEQEFVDTLVYQDCESLRKTLQSAIHKGYIRKTGSYFWGKL